MNHNNHDDYDAIDENGNPSEDPDTAKDHLADYFENLYQAREWEQSHEQWTNHINDIVNSISKSNAQSQNENPISRKLNTCIKKLKRNNSNGPDSIPNEVFIADEHTESIYLDILNKIYREEQIPQQWQHGEIKRLNKGKGTKDPKKAHFTKSRYPKKAHFTKSRQIQITHGRERPQIR